MLLGILAFEVTGSAFAESWYPGEGLKQGDYFRYNVCWIDYQNCTPLQIGYWVKNQTSDGTGWNLEFLAVDGAIVQKGMVTIGMVTPDPTHSDPNVSDYANVYKNTIIWLDSCATKYSPKGFNLLAWCRNGGVGGAPLVPEGQEDVTVQAGTYKAWVIGWHKSVDNKIWVVPSMPFPVKAQVFADVLQLPPPPQFNFELLETGNSATEPQFLNRAIISQPPIMKNCTKPDMQNDAIHGSKTTDSGSATIEYRYSPAVPSKGCPVEWRISVEKNFDLNQKYGAIHYDIFSVDNNGVKLDSVAQENGRADLFAPIGEDDRTISIKQSTPETHYVIAILGTGGEGSASDVSLAGLIKVDVKTVPEFPFAVLILLVGFVSVIVFYRVKFAK